MLIWCLIETFQVRVTSNRQIIAHANDLDLRVVPLSITDMLGSFEVLRSVHSVWTSFSVERDSISMGAMHIEHLIVVVGC